MNTEIKKAINKVINYIAEDYYETTHYDEDGHSFDMSWEDSINHAIDDFMSDVAGYMETQGYELTSDQEQEASKYAWNNVNWETIRDFA